MYNNAYNQLNQNQFIQNINQNFGNNYLNQQQQYYNINYLYKINQNQFQYSQILNTNNPYNYILNNNNNIYQNNLNNIQYNNNQN